jgi:hypothetical protein
VPRSPLMLSCNGQSQKTQSIHISQAHMLGARCTLSAFSLLHTAPTSMQSRSRSVLPGFSRRLVMASTVASSITDTALHQAYCQNNGSLDVLKSSTTQHITATPISRDTDRTVFTGIRHSRTPTSNRRHGVKLRTGARNLGPGSSCAKMDSGEAQCTDLRGTRLLAKSASFDLYPLSRNALVAFALCDTSSI